MANMMTVRPARENLLVRQPERDGDPLPAEGASVPRNAYWLARLRDEDVVVVKKTSVAKKTKED